MEFGLQADNLPHITFTAPASANFMPLDVVIPFLGQPTSNEPTTPGQLTLDLNDLLDPTRFRGPDPVAELYQTLDAEIKKCCGNSDCKGTSRIATAKQIGQIGVDIVTGVTLLCASTECPLIDPPYADDNEVLKPLPPAPSLEAAVELQLPRV